jgi:hypothetical protein
MHPPLDGRETLAGEVGLGGRRNKVYGEGASPTQADESVGRRAAARAARRPRRAPSHASRLTLPALRRSCRYGLQ